jgi:hypothetical protein
VLLAFFGYGDLIGDWYATPSPHPRDNQRKIGAEVAWQQVSGPAVADARERKGDGGIFYNFCRNPVLAKSVSGFDPHMNRKSFPFHAAEECHPAVSAHSAHPRHCGHRRAVRTIADDGEGIQKHDVPFQFHQIAGAEHGLSEASARDREAQRKPSL